MNDNRLELLMHRRVVYTDIQELLNETVMEFPTYRTTMGYAYFTIQAFWQR